MLLQRLRWLLPALIVSWTNLLQLGAALPAHDERSSAAISTMIHQDYKRVHPPDGKNDTQSSHKLVASPAGLLRPDKFQFYTYNDKGDMITRQMTAQEIQGLIAAGGADHVAIDRQEPQKADDVLTGGKKVMDVVQKVQNVLKSALDKPPTLTGTIPKIPEHANVEWSNILPSILSGETDAISSSNDYNQSLHKLTTEKLEAGSSSVEYASSTGSALNTAITTSDNPKKKPITQSDIQTNAYAGFTNNMEHSEKPHHSQQKPAAGTFTEKPMIPVPVITLTEQKLSTLHSAVTESPVFQMLSVIPAETVDSGHIKEDQTVSLATTELSSQTAGLLNQTDQFVELTLSEVPEDTTFSQLTSIDIYPVNITKQTSVSFDNKVNQGIGISTNIYSTTSVSTASSAVDTNQAATYNEFYEVTDEISSSSISYVPIRNKNNTNLSEDSLFLPGVTKESQVNVTYNNDKIVPQTITTISGPLSHASVASLKPQGLSNESALHLSSTFASVSRIETSTVPLLPHTDHENSSTVTESHITSQSTKVQPSSSMEPLPTQLIDSFSSVMNQISEARPSVLSLMPEMSIVSINPDSSKTTVVGADNQYDASHSTNEYVERIASSQNYATTKPQLHDATISTTGYFTTQRSTVMAMSSGSTIDVPAKPSTSTTIKTTSNVVINNLATAPSKPNIASTDTTISESMTSSPVWVQFEKVHNASLKNQNETFVTPEIATIANAVSSEKHVTDGVTPSEETLPGISTVLDIVKTQLINTPMDTSYKTDSFSKPTTSTDEFDSTLIKLNWSNPVSAIDQVLNIASLPPSTPPIEPISLPTDTLNLLANDLASGLIAGFATSTSENFEEIGVNKIASHKNTPSLPTVRPATLSDVTKHAEITQIYKETNDERNITQTSTQASLVFDKNVLTKKPTKLSSSNEKINDSTKIPLVSLLNNFANISDESKDSVGEDTIIAEVVTVNPERLSTIYVSVRPPNTNKTVLNTNYNQDKKDDREKVKTTATPIVTTEYVSPELPLKVASIDSGNDNDTGKIKISVSTESSAKTESEKNDFFANISSTAQTTAHKQHENFLGPSEFANDSNSALYSPYETWNVTSKTPILLNKTSTNSAFLQNANRINNVTFIKNKDTYTTAPTISHITTVTFRTPVQNNKNNYNASFSSSQEDSQIIKVVTHKLPGNTSGNNEEFSRPSPINGTHYLNASDQNNKNVLPQYTMPTEESSAKNTSMQINGQPNNTDSKPASLKHSENPSKPEIIHLQLSTLQPSNVPVRQSVKPAVNHKFSEESEVSKTDADSNTEDKWTLISQQTPPVMTKLPRPPKPPKPTRKPGSQTPSNLDENINIRSPDAESSTAYQPNPDPSQAQSVLPLDASQSASGLDVTVKHTSADIVNFAKLCNELAFNFWVATNKGLSTARSLALSPFGMTSLLAMIFLGARGPTSDQMNEVLGLDDVATFNPHLVFQNITDTVSLARGQGIANAAFVRELFADKMKVRKLMPFYKEQAQQFYEGLVAEVNFATISDLVRRRTNLLIRKQTGGRIKDFVKTNTVPLRSPLAALSANVFQTDCNTSLTSSVGRDGELYFAVSPAVRQRRLVPVPATTWRSGVLAGYEPSIDATAVALGGSDKLVSTIFVLPGQQGHTAPGDTLDRLEQRLVRSAFRDGTWNKLLKVLIPRSGLELQVPKFSHRSVVNATAALKRMGLDELFSGNADLKGINGIGHRLHLADVLQMNLFSTCGDENILSGRHHVETYPASPLRSIRRRIGDTNDNVPEDDTPRYYGVPSQEDIASSFYADRLYREKRQLSTTSEKPRLKLDRPFLYFVRHNPSDIILHMGRFNPRLLP